jgi:hypothetical protein
MIPEDLRDAAPSASATRWAEPNPEWVAAIELLKKDANAKLPD